MNLLHQVEDQLLLELNNKHIPYFKKGDFLKVDRGGISDTVKQKSVFGKCISYKRKGINSSFTLLYSVDNYKIIENFPLYSRFIKNITVFDKK